MTATEENLRRDWHSETSLVAQTVKNLPALWESWVWSLGWEDPLEEGMSTHSSILAEYWILAEFLENPHGLRRLVGSSAWGHKESHTTEWLSISIIWHTEVKPKEHCHNLSVDSIGRSFTRRTQREQLLWHSEVCCDPAGEKKASWASLIKNLSEGQETWVWFLGQEDPLE